MTGAKVLASAFWRRLDEPGHDACTLTEEAAGFLLEGTAVFRQEGEVGALAYAVRCDRAWISQRGTVRGRLGGRVVDWTIARAGDGAWTLNGAPVGGLEACLDLDFGFTPATNLFQLRRLGLTVGAAGEAPVAWMDAASATLSPLPQRYERRGEASYWYESPRFDYRALLELLPNGFVRLYPGLWEFEA